jgi:hypothetical protein
VILQNNSARIFGKSDSCKENYGILCFLPPGFQQVTRQQANRVPPFLATLKLDRRQSPIAQQYSDSQERGQNQGLTVGLTQDEINLLEEIIHNLEKCPFPGSKHNQTTAVRPASSGTPDGVILGIAA